MSGYARAVTLDQAAHCLSSGRKILCERDFAALRRPCLSLEQANNLILAARHNLLRLSGTLVAGSPHCPTPGDYVIAEDVEIPIENLVWSGIFFEENAISCTKHPSGIPEPPEDAPLYFVNVRIDVASLKALRRQLLESRRQRESHTSKRGPRDKYEKVKLGAVATAIVDEMGLPPKQIELVRKMFDIMGDDAPGESSLKEFAKTFYSEFHSAKKKVDQVKTAWT